jgi:hypothetical protein
MFSRFIFHLSEARKNSFSGNAIHAYKLGLQWFQQGFDGRGCSLVVPPFLKRRESRGYAAKANFCFGVMPPMAMLGRS